jgi:hypothetical protein
MMRLHEDHLSEHGKKINTLMGNNGALRRDDTNQAKSLSVLIYVPCLEEIQAMLHVHPLQRLEELCLLSPICRVQHVTEEFGFDQNLPCFQILVVTNRESLFS